MKKTNRFYFYILGVLMVFQPSVSAKTIEQNPQATVFETIMQRVRDSHFKTASPQMAASVDSSLVLLQQDGSFSDLDYTNTHRTLWTPQLHLDRITKMVNVYVNRGNRLFGAEIVYNSIVKALQFWQLKNPRSSNWWHNQIAVPQSMGVILIGMRAGTKQIPQELERAILERMASTGGDPKKQTGANKVDVAIHWLYRSCLEKNTDNLALAVDESFFSLVQTNKEGIQQDWSYFQHGQQLYIGGYGKVLIDGVVSVAKLLTDTPYALSGARLEVLSTFVRDTYLKSIRGQHHLYNVLGRGMTRKGSISQVSFARTLEILKKIDPKHAPEYDQAIDRLKGKQDAGYAIQPLNKYYWRADYMLHQRPGYTFDVRMVSTRTARNENGNEENLKGYFLSDGGTDIALDGDEYASIIPVWDWTKIPGTTAPNITDIPMPNSWSEMGKTAFAGGVSDGMYGVCGYVMENKDFNINTFANKSWFFFDKEVVCLGAGIRSTAEQSIHSSVNQCMLNSEVVVKAANKDGVQESGEQSYTQPEWVWHNRIAYFFPQQGAITVSNKVQRGALYDVNKTQSKEIQSKEVFSLWFDHGKQPLADRYAYIVVPNIDKSENVKSSLINEIEILANTDSVQVVHHKKLGIYSFMFFRAGRFSNEGINITTNKACALLIKNPKKGELRIFASDPVQEDEAIKLKVQFPGMKGEKSLNCEKLSFPFNGSTKEYILTENK